MIFNPRKWLLLGCSFVVTCLLGACGNQAGTSPANVASAPAPPAAAAAPPPAAEAAPPQEGRNASVAELLSASDAAAPVAENATEPSPNAGAGQSAQPPAVVESETPSDDTGFARVVSVSKIPGSRQICTDHRVVERRKQEDDHRVAGTVIGAIAGGLIGNKIGRGRGRSVATVGGAVAGGAIGREVQGAHQDRDTVTRVVRHCRPVRPSEEGNTLYDVVYSYQGQNFNAKLDYDPGDRIALPVRSVE